MPVLKMQMDKAASGTPNLHAEKEIKTMTKTESKFENLTTWETDTWTNCLLVY